MTRRSSELQRFQMPAVEARVQAAILAPIGDASSEAGAEKLRDAMLDAWRKRIRAGTYVGPLPVITIVPKLYRVGAETRTRFELHSNIKNGLPVAGATA